MDTLHNYIKPNFLKKKKKRDRFITLSLKAKINNIYITFTKRNTLFIPNLFKIQKIKFLNKSVKFFFFLKKSFIVLWAGDDRL